MNKIFWKKPVLLCMLLFLLAGCGRNEAAMAPATQEIEQETRQETKRETEEDKEQKSLQASEAKPDEAVTEAEGEHPDERSGEEETGPAAETFGQKTPEIREQGSYTSKEDVALYLYTYGRLPDNFITKKEAQALGWSGGSLEEYAPGKCIGGSFFGNYEGLLPEAKGREYHECDIDTLGKEKRGAKRIVYSNDGLIYYTADHYESFELLYGTP